MLEKMDKASLRSYFLCLRKDFATDKHRYLYSSANACGKITDLTQWQNSSTVALYAPIRGEVDTNSLDYLARLTGKRVFYPKCAISSKGVRHLNWHVVSDVSFLNKGAFGIMEPDEARCPLAYDPPDLVVVPALALAHNGARLGYGGGYYDRTFANRDWSSVVALGLVFSCQLIDELPCEEHDMKVSIIVTEESVECLM